MATTASVDVLLRRADKLGECPIWDDSSGALYWVDSRAPAVHRCDPANGTVDTWPQPAIVGSIAFRRGGGLLLALQSGIHKVDRPGDQPSLVVDPEPDRPTNRLNDGRCDPAGRFWVGSMSEVAREPLGSLYCLDADGTCRRAFNEVIVPNSLAWSPDGRTMYFADTYRQTIWRFDYDMASGAVAERRVFRDTRGQPGRPDGSAVDADGCLWNCEYGGGRVVRYRPDGEIDQVVPVPAANPTCCCFGGADLRTLFVTSATQRLTPEQLAQQPLAGSVFAVRVPISGMPEYRFAD